MSENTKKKIITRVFIIAGTIEVLLLLVMNSLPNSGFVMSIGSAVIFELFITIHMSLFVLYPIAKIINDDPKNVKKSFIKMFAARAIFLVFTDIFISPTVAIFDFLSLFIGIFILVPICALKFSNKKIFESKTSSSTTQPTEQSTPDQNKCPKCGNVVSASMKYCAYCGEKVVIAQNPLPENQHYVIATDFDPMFAEDGAKLVETFITKTLEKAKIDKKSLPNEVLKRKKNSYIIFCMLLFIYISMIFFHFPILTYIIGAIILIILFRKTKKYTLIEYIKKEISSRPNEKISNIIMPLKANSTPVNIKKTVIAGVLAATILPLIIFSKPRILYEKMDNGYGVRFYAFGLINFKTAEIPSSYKGQPVISLRGNTFSNMPFLTKVTLPDTITEIRGQAFKNDILLKEVNIPINLEYLGGGAFYNCRSIISITLPDTLTTMGGEVFKNASSLETIKLSENLTEIRGNSFEECTSLKEVTIPDKVTRIGGHAFYGNTSLSTVTFTENSQLKEIGSSAFRKCSSLYTITIPKNAYVNFRAFKESPTSIRYFGYGQRSKFIYVTPDDLPSEVVSADYGTVYIKVDEVNYINYNDWEVKVSLTGGLTENLTFDYYHNEIFVKENFNLSISSCHSDEKVGIDISYN